MALLLPYGQSSHGVATPIRRRPTGCFVYTVSNVIYTYEVGNGNKGKQVNRVFLAYDNAVSNQHSTPYECVIQSKDCSHSHMSCVHAALLVPLQPCVATLYAHIYRPRPEFFFFSCGFCGRVARGRSLLSDCLRRR